MYEDKDIIDNAVNSADHTTLVAAVKAAGLVDTLKGTGPFTVLAPTNEAFAALPAGTVDTLLKPENKDKLTQILECHVIAGTVTSADIARMVSDDGGMHTVDTLGGCKLTFKADNGMVTVTDENGTTANVTVADVMQSNASSTSSTPCSRPRVDRTITALIASSCLRLSRETRSFDVQPPSAAG
jgi:uncharacterized surface protein with fasciclin (FAS1) repeats